MKMLLTVCAVLGVVAVEAAPTLTRSMPFTTWIKVAQRCHARIASPPVANADGTHQITMTGSVEELKCAEKMLAKPQPRSTP